MKIFILLAVFGAGLGLAQAARAQSMVPNGQNGPQVQPKPRTPDFAPPAIPGAGGAQGIATAPKVAKVNQGDPTTELFTAINANDYASAQDAISRGADLTAQNALGETPLDLSISLNQNSITFLLLGARNETGAAALPAVAQGQTHARPHTVPAAMAAPPYDPPAPHAPAPVAGNNPGTPDAAAGFLGFGPKN
jgi:hypothetical protein